MGMRNGLSSGLGNHELVLSLMRPPARLTEPPADYCITITVVAYIKALRADMLERCAIAWWKLEGDRVAPCGSTRNPPNTTPPSHRR
jgi:hypothetical protein